jgi:predicted transcriptional regulator
MKAVLISIQPKWVELIASGKKTIEVRKTRPKLETPFKCYIYMSQGDFKNLRSYSDWIYQNRMKVIGEFVCDSIDEYGANYHGWYRYPMEETCLWADEIAGYGQGKHLYGWHISDLVIYDNPKELGEFYKHCPEASSFEKGSCYEHCIFKDYNICKNFCFSITRPPQSWFYCEELGE